MKYFLLVYNQTTGELEELQAFEHDDLSVAMMRRLSFERHTQSRPDVEVVLLSAESEEALRSTHGRYFKSAAQLAS